MQDQQTFDEYIERARFNGADYKHDRDAGRLGEQLKRVYDVLKSGQWFTLSEIEERTGDPQASISAQMRHLRKPRFGSHTIEKIYIENGLYKYRMVI